MTGAIESIGDEGPNESAGRTRNTDYMGDTGPTRNTGIMGPTGRIN
jgi:hypothetical protein